MEIADLIHAPSFLLWPERRSLPQRSGSLARLRELNLRHGFRRASCQRV